MNEGSFSWSAPDGMNKSDLVSTRQMIYAMLLVESFLMLVHVDRLVQERRNSITLAIELLLSCTNPPMCELKSILI